ncbi:Rho GTPase activation protein [Phanerochaete sordida]|uniref:Rho GTPase activation protein n=1 Tax=Phanerochaete sordida TaxID=48140 RepID=A0A9P3G0S8_9APHY|nr:Rho GTPase activation protein [Phanerochaete sordida]
MYSMPDPSFASSSSHHGASTSMSGTPKEFDVNLEVYISRAATNHHKLNPPVPRKKSEKRDSLRNMPSSSDLGQKKVKEKSSWLSFPRGTNVAEHWRSAKCTLEEQNAGTFLCVYIENTVLYRQIYVHTLYQTDIRNVHHSLFRRRDCLGLFANVKQRGFSPTHDPEPLYLHFPDTETLNLWVVLLRTYAIPEVYGRWDSQQEGGLYRMWRQVDLTCIQARNLGVVRSVDDTSQPDPEETSDMNVYCSLMVNGYLSGKTAVRKGLGAPDWHESFCFSDLPPFETLDVMVWREKKLPKQVLIGTVSIPLMNFRRGEAVEGWFPVLSTHNGTGVIAGEIRLKIRVDEEIILPHSAYEEVVKTLQAKNYLDWISELESKLNIRNLSNDIVAVALAEDSLLDNIMELADREVDGTERSHSTLFRGNTVFTKTMEIFMMTKGAAFLEASLGSPIRKLCEQHVAIETDASRSGKNPKQIEKNVELLVHWCNEFWQSIYDAREKCPDELRRLFSRIRTLIETRYQVREDRYSDLPWQGVSAFVFLRFFVPAILHPHHHGFWPGLTDEPVQRSQTLIAKVLQSLANLNTRDDTARVKEFLTNSTGRMIEYILCISSTGSETVPPSPSIALNKRERMRITSALWRKSSTIPQLHRESIPHLPHMLDVGKHLAIITSIVVRNTRRHLPARTGMPSERDFDSFCQACLEVEEQALSRVSKLASRGRPGASPRNISAVSSPVSPTTTTISATHSARAPSSERRRLRKGKRPMTAALPGPLDSQPSSSSYQSTPTGSHVSIPRVMSHDSLTTARQSSLSSRDHSSTTEEPPIPGPSRPLLINHARSASTDSALSRRGRSLPSSPPSSFAFLSHSADTSDEVPVNGKKRGLLRGILRK